jgi:transcription antitermination factor NusG
VHLLIDAEPAIERCEAAVGDASGPNILRSASDCSRVWHVLHVKSRQEKALARDLASLAIAGYLPLTRQIRFYGKRKVCRHVPLFGGYVFLYGRVADAHRACQTRRVVRILPVENQVRLARELEQMRRATVGGYNLEPHPYLLKGTQVSIRHGPLRGVEGIIETNSGRDRLVLSVAMLGTAASVEIDASIIEAAG